MTGSHCPGEGGPRPRPPSPTGARPSPRAVARGAAARILNTLAPDEATVETDGGVVAPTADDDAVELLMHMAVGDA